jgi:hypothetical protein
VVVSDNRSNDARGVLAAKAAGKNRRFRYQVGRDANALAELLHDRMRFADRQGLTDEDWSVAQSNVGVDDTGRKIARR